MPELFLFSYISVESEKLEFDFVEYSVRSIFFFFFSGFKEGKLSNNLVFIIFFFQPQYYLKINFSFFLYLGCILFFVLIKWEIDKYQ